MLINGVFCIQDNIEETLDLPASITVSLTLTIHTILGGNLQNCSASVSLCMYIYM